MAKGRGFWSEQFSDADYLGRWKARCVINGSGCWLWQGPTHWNGYASASYRGENMRLHRASYQIHRGEPAPAGWDVCHTCDNKNCINPLHLFAGPRAVNIEDMRAKGRGNNQKKTHCPRGHSYVEYGMPHATHKSWRLCRICQRGKQRVYAGWPEELAYTAPRTPPGQRPVNANFTAQRAKKRRPVDSTDGHTKP